MSSKGFKSIPHFKAAVQVGDILMGYRTQKEVRVTAIGETRFLYIDIDSHLATERVSLIINMSANWQKIQATAQATV